MRILKEKMFRIEFSNRSKKFLKKCEDSLYERLMVKIKSLKENPFPQDAKRVVGQREKIFRIRVGKCRIEYVVFHERNLIFISDVDNRPRVYNK